MSNVHGTGVTLQVSDDKITLHFKYPDTTFGVI